MLKGLFRTKNLDDILASIGGPQLGLKRTLGAFNVTLIGIGAIIGAGIFATVGSAAAGDVLAGRPGAGPSLMLSFVITAIVCGFTALCYAAHVSWFRRDSGHGAFWRTLHSKAGLTQVCQSYFSNTVALAR